MDQPGAANGGVWLYYDNDGDVDVLISNSNQPAILLRNDGGSDNNWLRVALEGSASNRDGIGARVTVMVNGATRIAEVQSGSSYCSASDRRLLFGLGDATGVDRLHVAWPSGREADFANLPANETVVVVEP